MSVALSGTASGGITEADIVAGGKTIILTLTGDTWIPSGTMPRGPQVISQPPDPVVVIDNTSIAAATAANPPGTTFWIKAGTYNITSSIVPKSGNVYVGEYGAILDGTSWTGSTDTDGAFKGHNLDIDDVVIRNLFIQNMPRYGIQNYFNYNNGWTIEYCEISYCRDGLNVSEGFTVQHNYIHHNVGPNPGGAANERGGGYLGDKCGNTLFWNNEISFNGAEQKIAGFGGGSENVTFRANYVHDNQADGIWYDTVPDAVGLIEENICEDNGRNSISVESCTNVTVQNNTVRRSGDTGILITSSQDCTILTNTIEDSNRGLGLLVNFGAPSEDCQNNTFTSNTVKVPEDVLTNPWGITVLYAMTFSSAGGGDESPYIANTKHNDFFTNIYYAPDTSTTWFLWFTGKTFAQWQLVPIDPSGTQDSGGSINIG